MAARAMNSSTEEFYYLPAGVLDSSHATDSIIACGWVLDKAIDAEKVKLAWYKLVTHWPILSSRLVYDPKSKPQWMYRIPRTPTFKGSFASLSISESIHNHYNYAKPMDTIRCTIKENPHHLFFPYGPKSVEDILLNDRPLVHLHVTNFDDGALIGLAVPHILCDGHGVSAIIRALTVIMSEGSLPSPLDLTDPFVSYSPTSGAHPPSPPFWRALTPLQRMGLLLRGLWNRIFDNDVENRDVYIPKSEILRLKSQAVDDIRKEHGDDSKLFVSSSDVVLAFMLKRIHTSKWSIRPLNVFYTANLRSSPNFSIPFLRNAVAMIITPTLPVSMVSRMSLGSLGLHIRRTIQTQMTPSAVDVWLRWRLATVDKLRIFFSPWFGKWNVVTNWREMKLIGLDFSGALPDASRSAGETVKCVYVWGDGLQPLALRNWIGLWQDDPSGGMWVSAFLPKRIWRNPQGFGRYLS
ncbi:hypothetical protein VNI00_001199 [Paramarasmius palmivorus]|uniref:Uncharacterized protein n=1 Tax=Paramarasmius palmivorus TaxID=297713 RepID=A0AAW0E925_9AGAR